MKLLAGYLDHSAQETLLSEIRQIVRQAPLFTPCMPRTGKPFSVRMSNCGPLGWVADKQGYRYQSTHPITDEPWPNIPDQLLKLWSDLTDFGGEPEACLINHYEPRAKMGLHVDEDEEEFMAPIFSLSLGDDARFRLGGMNRKDPTKSFILHSGDVLLLDGEDRKAYHGIDRIYAGTSTLLKAPGRINLTMRRVTSWNETE